MEQFLAVYSWEVQLCQAERVVLPVTYSSREAFLNDLMMAARDAKAEHDAWQRQAAPYQKAMWENISRQLRGEPPIPDAELARLRPPDGNKDGVFTFCGREFRWNEFFWEEWGRGYVEVPPELYSIEEYFAKFGISPA